MCSKHKLLTFGFVLILFFFFIDTVSAQVMINEFLPNANQEWVEVFNSGSETIDLSNYYFDDDSSFSSDSGNSGKIALSGLLPQLTTCFWNLSTYLNNNGDNPTLFNLSGSTIDNYVYTTSVLDKSYSRIPDGGSWQADQSPTKSLVSCQDLAPTPTPTPTPAPTSTPTPTSKSTNTPTPTPTKTPTPFPTKSPTPKPTPTPTETMDSETPETFVLGMEDKSDEKEASESQKAKKGFPFLPILFIVAGLVCIGTALFLVFRKGRAYNEKSEENS